MRSEVHACLKSNSYDTISTFARKKSTENKFKCYTASDLFLAVAEVNSLCRYRSTLSTLILVHSLNLTNATEFILKALFLQNSKINIVNYVLVSISMLP